MIKINWQDLFDLDHLISTTSKEVAQKQDKWLAAGPHKRASRPAAKRYLAALRQEIELRQKLINLIKKSLGALMTDQAPRRNYPVLWVEIRVVFRIRQQGWLGICGYSQRVCKAFSDRDVRTLIVVQDLIVQDGRCEEDERCVDFACPLNHATRESYARANGMTQAQAKRLPDGFDTREPMVWNAHSDGLNAFRDLLEKHPRGGLVTQSRGNPRRRGTRA